MSDQTHDMQKEIRRYLLVFFALIVGTILTVLASKLNVPFTVGILIALFIATVKASLVACFFMHLISEKKLIYGVLSFTAFFFLAMMLLFIAGYYDLPQGSVYVP